MKTLIINIGPPGDVVRTTVLLRELDGEIYWLSKKSSKDVLKSDKIKRVFFLDEEKDKEEVKNIHFDKVISLNEEGECLDFLDNLKYDSLIGAYRERGEVKYTDDSAYWFDMSLVSIYGKEEADRLKKVNRKSLPEILMDMIGKEWKGQEYDIGYSRNNGKGRIGIISIVTGKWPNKGWKYYEELAEKLELDGYNVEFLGMKPTIKDHIDDINKCELVICGDTLGMHIALALGKKVIALFNCTSPDEIHDYGRMNKIVSPEIEKHYYKKEFDDNAISAVKLEEVYEKTIELLNSDGEEEE